MRHISSCGNLRHIESRRKRNAQPTVAVDSHPQTNLPQLMSARTLFIPTSMPIGIKEGPRQNNGCRTKEFIIETAATAGLPLSIWIMPAAIKNIKISPRPSLGCAGCGGRGGSDGGHRARTQKDYKWEGILDNICTLDVDCNVAGDGAGDLSPTLPYPSLPSPDRLPRLMSICINLLVLYLNIFARSLRF